MYLIKQYCPIKGFCVTIFTFILLHYSANINAQFLLGPTGHVSANQHVYNDVKLPESINSRPGLGYSGGVAIQYQLFNKEKINRYSLHVEFLYAKRGKTLKGGINNQFKNEASYTYIDFPVSLQYYFLKKKVYTLFFSGGGQFSYWLGGKGRLESFELHESFITGFNYDIAYRLKPEEISEDGDYIINIDEPVKWQSGLNFGFGALFKIYDKQRVLVKLNYKLVHSWLGRDDYVDVGLHEYKENFRSSDRILSLSVAYLFKYDLFQGRKGKSTFRR